MKDNVEFYIKDKWRIKIYTKDGVIEDMVPVGGVVGVIKSADYGKHFSPTLIMDAKFSAEQVYLLKENDNKCICHVTCRRFTFEDSKTTTDEDANDSEIIIDTHFAITFEAEDLSFIHNMSPESEITDENQGDILKMKLNDVTLYLTSLEYTKIRKMAFNEIASGPDIDAGTVLQFLCETTGAKYVVDRPDNIIGYSNIILPSTKFKSTIHALQVLYGIYTEGLLVHYDIDGILYILSKLSKVHAHEGKMETVQLLLSADTSDGGNLVDGKMMYTDDGSNLVVFVPMKFTENENAVSSGEANGDSIIFTNNTFGRETFTYINGDLDKVNSPIREYLKNSQSHLETGHSFKLDYDEISNPFNLLSKLVEDSICNYITVSIKNPNMDMFKPNIIYTANIVDGSNEDVLRYKNRFFMVSGYEITWHNEGLYQADAYMVSTANVVLVDINFDENRKRYV